MNKYWFRKRNGIRSKDLGWGWTPVSWEGWLLIAALLGAVVASAFLFLGENIVNDVKPALVNLFVFLGSVALFIGIAIFISLKKTRP